MVERWRLIGSGRYAPREGASGTATLNAGGALDELFAGWTPDEEAFRRQREAGG